MVLGRANRDGGGVDVRLLPGTDARAGRDLTRRPGEKEISSRHSVARLQKLSAHFDWAGPKGLPDFESGG